MDLKKLLDRCMIKPEKPVVPNKNREAEARWFQAPTSWSPEEQYRLEELLAQAQASAKSQKPLGGLPRKEYYMPLPLC